jgi:hypothetical protein
MTTNRPTQAALARELGISGPAVTKLKAQGMPTDSIEAARTWRLQNLNPAKRKPDPGPSPAALVAKAQELGELAHNALRLGQFASLAPALQASMRAVPAEHRHAVQLPVTVFDELLRPILELIQPATDKGQDEEHAGAAMSDEEAADMGAFWYGLAAGEQVPTP